MGDWVFRRQRVGIAWDLVWRALVWNMVGIVIPAAALVWLPREWVFAPVAVLVANFAGYFEGKATTRRRLVQREDEFEYRESTPIRSPWNRPDK